ncbi:MAG TPA: hypothetical protein VE377_15235 [Candidatus Dormibacteraeota bacterium]|nr:hypothetical protein [Candidatus Dormibacteraeota bacterium]
MMRRAIPQILLLAALSVPVFAQAAPPVLYAESFRQGRVPIEEDGFSVGVSARSAGYVEHVTDSRGNDRYELGIETRLDEAGNIVSWSVLLRDLRHPRYGNVLMCEREPSDDPIKNLWLLDTSHSSPVPIDAKRVIKVDGFYVTIQVKNRHFAQEGASYPDYADVHFTFTNSDPRTPLNPSTQ